MSKFDEATLEDASFTLEEQEGEKLLGAGQDLDLAPPSPAWRRYCSLSSLWWLTNATLLFVIAYLAFQLDESRTLLWQLEFAGDVNGVWPRMPQRVVEFQPDHRFVGNLTSPTFIDDVKLYWLDLVPKGLGFIEVPNYAEIRGMPRPYFKYNKPVYTTSVTHQLHCLYMIMHGFNDLVLNHGSFAMKMAGEEGDDGLTREGEDPAEHLSHCFDYLRQAVMCHGDTALEGLQTTFGPDVGGSDGWNVKHVCKPWDRIHSWLEDQRIDDREWI